MTEPSFTKNNALQRVIEGGLCIGCGACAGLDSSIKMSMDQDRKLIALLPDEHVVDKVVINACPFSGTSLNEDELSDIHFQGPDYKKDGRIGRYLETFAGWVEEGDYRAVASSGGVGTWLQCELLSLNLVDAVLNVAESGETSDDTLFSFSIARTVDEARDHAKTRYYPVEMSTLIQHILAYPGRYAIIGTPCFVKAVRLAAHQNQTLADRIIYTLGIVCGHLKSAAFAEALAWQCELEPERIERIDFRAKLSGRPASRYGVAITGKPIPPNASSSVTRPMEGLLGANWGHGLFKYKACEFCDDVLAETADVVVGDAWLPVYEADHRGTNVIIVRHPQLLLLMQEAQAAGRIHLEKLSADDVAESQAGGLRHRRDGLAYRLWLEDRAGRWRPKKRVSASRMHLPPSMRRIHRMRLELGQFSHEAFRQAKERADFSHFERLMAPLIARYDREIRPSRLRRVWNLLERKLEQVRLRFVRGQSRK